jgi:hypothetical protein
MIVRFFDTESSGLTGGFGRLHSYSAVDLPIKRCPSLYRRKCNCRSECVTFRRDREPWNGGPANDHKLALAIKQHLEAADIIVGWNSILHDIPLVNARLTAWGEEPVRIGDRYGTSHVDLMFSVPKIGGRSLDTTSKFYDSPHRKTPLLVATWARASEGDSAAFDEIVEHNEWDALVTRDMWPHLAPFVSKVTIPLKDFWHVVVDIPSRRERVVK